MMSTNDEFVVICDSNAVIDPDHLTVSIVGKSGIGKLALTTFILGALKNSGLPVASLNCDIYALITTDCFTEDPDKALELCQQLPNKGIKIHVTEQTISPQLRNIPVFRNESHANTRPSIEIGPILRKASEDLLENGVMTNTVAALKKAFESEDDVELIYQLSKFAGRITSEVVAGMEEVDAALDVQHNTYVPSDTTNQLEQSIRNEGKD